MNVNRVRTLVIVFLIMLNVILYYFNYAQSKAYQISGEQAVAITNVLNKNGITVSTPIPKDFTPLRQIQLRPFQKDSIEMCNLFFGEILAPEANMSEEPSNKTEFKKGTKSLSIEKGSFTFINPTGNEKIDLNLAEAERLCMEMLDALDSNNSLNLSLDYSYTNDDSMILEYRAKYTDEIIFSSTARFVVNKNGIVRVRASFYEPVGFDSTAKNIHSPDEALLAFLYEWRNVYGTDTKTTIKRIDMVYKTEETSNDKSTILKAAPFYRIYVLDEAGQDIHDSFLVNAYTSTVTR